MLFYALLVVWTTDSGAYFIGRRLENENYGQIFLRIRQWKDLLVELFLLLLFAIIFQIFYPIASSYLVLVIVTIISFNCRANGGFS